MSACSVLSSLKKDNYKKKKQQQQKNSLSFHVSVFFNVNKLKKKTSGQCKLTFLIANSVVISLQKKVSSSSSSSCCCSSSFSCSSSSYFSSSPSSSLFFFFVFFYIIVFFFFFVLHFRLQILSFKIHYCSINSITDTIAASK